MPRGPLNLFAEISSVTGARHLLVPARHVHRWSEATAYARLLEATQEHSFAMRDLTAIAHDLGCRALDASEVARFLARQIAAGVLFPIEMPDVAPRGYFPVMRRGDAPANWDDAMPVADLIEEGPAADLAWIEIVCIGVAGAAYAGASVSLRLPTSDVVELRLDGASRLRLESIASPGSCGLQLSADARRSGLVPLGERPQIDGREPRIAPGGAALRLGTNARHVVVVEAGHAYSC